MSTPIETNTEALQEILQTVYNLPMAGGGSAKPDLVITGIPETGTGDYFAFDFGSYTGGGYGPNRVAFDQEKVIAAYEKLLSGKEVRATLMLPTAYLNSWNGACAAVFPAIRVAAFPNNDPVKFLTVRFECATFFSSAGIGDYYTFDYTFVLNLENRTVEEMGFNKYSRNV